MIVPRQPQAGAARREMREEQGVTNNSKLDGGCLCGAVRYGCDAEPALTALCHCRHCQKQTSAPFSIVVAVPKGSFRIERGTLTTFDDVGDSGQPVQRSFCGRCGSP